ncbi:ester cyclase [Halorarius litoreus]|uniref:ester cyclase n=1 Tax=Halorarius litoreus TaxID=2962676 RepID=UPI0020CE4A63|nr:ester cyclase [Halorarius litoreus]
MAIASPTAENIEMSERFTAEVFNERDLDALDELCAADCVVHDVPGETEIKGIDAYRAYMKSVLDGFSDLKAETAFCFGQDDLVCTRTNFSGTHDGEFMGIPATDRSVEISGTTIARYEDGKMVESWSNLDTLGLLTQVGVVDMPST